MILLSFVAIIAMVLIVYRLASEQQESSLVTFLSWQPT